MGFGDVWKKSKRLVLIGAVAFSFLGSTYTIGDHQAEAARLNMSYLYFGNTNTFVAKVDQTNDSLQTVSPSYFDLKEDGTLDDKVDPIFVKAMHERGIKVVPFLSNHWDRNKGKNALLNREALVKQIKEAIEKYNLDGIHVDLENLTPEERESYTDLMKLLDENLKEDKEVSIAVAANPYKTNKGWQGSYDYEKLANYSDYLMIMAYDESYQGSEPGPVASLQFVEKSIQYALEKVPSNKIVLGIPFYGRYWKGTSGGSGIALDRVEELINQYQGVVRFDENSKTPVAEFTVPNGESPSVYYWTLRPGKYQVWYENEMSLKYKLKLVQKYNLLGTASWSLNAAPSKIWDFYQPWLDGKHIFVDADQHWAEDAIMSMYNRGWMLGTTEDTFSPNQALTRAQATVVLVRALELDKSTSVSSTSFKDVGTSFWAKKEIDIAFSNGLIKGISTEEFAPNRTISRAEMAALLNRVLKLDKDKTISIAENTINFEDVSSAHWAYSDIIKLADRNIFKGIEDHIFQPYGIVTRAQMATLMNRISDQLNN